MEALRYYKLSLKAALQMYGDRSEFTAFVYGDVGSMLERKGLYASALLYHERSLVIRISVWIILLAPFIMLALYMLALFCDFHFII